MCGIFGYYNYRVPRTRREVLECLLTGLRRLEYRGYDSAGLSVDAQPLRTASSPADVDGGKENRPGGRAALPLHPRLQLLL